MKILAGAYRADGGEIEIDGNAGRRSTAQSAAERLGIGMIYQEFNLVPDSASIENIVLGIEPDARAVSRSQSRGREARPRVLARARHQRSRSTGRRAGSRSREQQLTEIAKALVRHARLIVMDEPTAALTERETDALFALIAQAQGRGVAFVYISHRLEELPRIADRITVMRDGRGDRDARRSREMPQDEMIRLMVGRALEAHFPDLPPVAPTRRCGSRSAICARRRNVNGVSFDVRAGEIVGLAGLVGAGRTEIVRAIAGADVADRRQVAIDGTRS